MRPEHLVGSYVSLICVFLLCVWSFCRKKKSKAQIEFNDVELNNDDHLPLINEDRGNGETSHSERKRSSRREGSIFRDAPIPEEESDSEQRKWHRDSLFSEEKPCSFDPDDEADSHQLGKIQFNIKYCHDEMTLNLKIIRAIDLPAMDLSGKSDPYVEVMLLPDKKLKIKTEIKHKQLNPRWNELLAFEGFPYSKLQQRILYMKVLDYDLIGRDDPIGEVAINLKDLNLTVGETLWKALQPCEGSGPRGEIELSLCYKAEWSSGKLTIGILQAKNLKPMDINGSSDPYVKIWLLVDGKRIEKKKTAVKQNELNPVYNQFFEFSMTYDKMRQTNLLVKVMDYDRFGRNDLIGELVLGSKGMSTAVKHWNEMFTKNNVPSIQWHILK